MAKTRRYIITTGAYDDYKVLAQVEGPARPALSTIYKRFQKEYGVPGYPEYDKAWAHNTMNRIGIIWEAQKRMKKDGLEGGDLAELFLDYIQKHHGFVVIELPLFHVS